MILFGHMTLDVPKISPPLVGGDRGGGYEECRMGQAKSLVPLELVERTILLVKGQKVILDADLAKLYGVTTKRLNRQMNRNRGRFPENFMFQLTAEEKGEVVANCDQLPRLKFSPVLPFLRPSAGS
jgi:hypothetical protein